MASKELLWHRIPAIVAISVVAACARVEPVAAPAAMSVEVQVEGMTCSGCEQTIAASVGALPGVVSCRADHVRGLVTVAYDPARSGEAEVRAAIRAAGFQTP